MIFKRLANALIRQTVCAGSSEPLLVAHTTFLEISCRGLFVNVSVYGFLVQEGLIEYITGLNELGDYVQVVLLF